MSKAKTAVATAKVSATVITPARTIPELMWTAETLCGGKAVTFAKAQQAVKELDIGGFTDWRLPTREELLTLVDLDKYHPAIDSERFPDTELNLYWSSTPYANNPAGCAWGVCFRNGNVYIEFRDGSGFVRAVRSVSPASPGQ